MRMGLVQSVRKYNKGITLLDSGEQKPGKLGCATPARRRALSARRACKFLALPSFGTSVFPMNLCQVSGAEQHPATNATAIPFLQLLKHGYIFCGVTP